MRTAKSFISGKEMPLDQLYRGANLNPQILQLIVQDHPGFNEDTYVTAIELSEYRKRYLSQLLKIEKREASKLEKEVIESINDNQLLSHKLGSENLPPPTFGQKIADKVAAFGGSWAFIIVFFIFLLVWMGTNVAILEISKSKPFDPYPFILLNLILSTLASIQAPVILMSQNRKETRDRQRAENDYKVNLKAELEIRLLHEKIDHLILHQNQRLIDIQEIQTDLLNDILKKVEKA